MDAVGETAHAPGTGGMARWEWAALTAVLIVAGALRIWHLDWALPHELDSNEPIYLRIAARLAEEGGTNPHLFSRAHLMTTINRAAIALVRAAGNPPRGIRSDQIMLWFQADPQPFYLTARGAMVLLGLISIVIIHRYGRTVGGPVAGLVAAAMLGVCSVHVGATKNIAGDAPLILALIAVPFATHRFLLDKRLYSLMWAFAWVGVAGGAKINDAMFGGIPALALLLTAREAGPGRTIFRAALGGLCAFLGFFAANFYVVFHPKLAYIGFMYQWGLAGEPHFWAEPVSALVEYSRILGLDLGLVGLLGGVLVLARAPREGRRPHLPAICLGAVYFLFMVSKKLHYPRYILPMVPILAPYCGLAVARVAAAIRGGALRAVAVAACLAILGARGVKETWSTETLKGRGDTRILASEWCIANLPDGACIATEPRAVQLPDVKEFERAGMTPSNRGPALSIWGGKAFRVLQPWNVGEMTLAQYREKGVKYLAIAGWTWERMRSRGGYDAQFSAADETLAASRAIARFSPTRSEGGDLDGPFIVIYEIPDR